MDGPESYHAGLASSAQALDAGDPVEALVEAQDLPDPVRLHDGEVHRISCRTILVPKHRGPRLVDDLAVDRQHVVHDAEQRVERRLNRVARWSQARSVDTVAS
jgi:hypothetical protein